MEKNNIGFLFAGQGTQSVGMGQDFYETYPLIRSLYENNGLEFDLKDLCFNGPQSRLDQTEFAQPAILLTSIVIATLLDQNGIQPRMIAGFSLGEYSALTYAKALDRTQSLRLVRQRGKLMSNALNGKNTAMLALINLEGSIVEEIVEQARAVGVCDIASINCPGQIVISGDVEALNVVKKHVKERKGLALPVNVSGAFHSRCLAEAEKPLRQLLTNESFQPPALPIVRNLTGTIDVEDPVETLVKQMTSTVKFEASIRTMIHHGISTFIEIGPGEVLAGFVRKIDPTLQTFSIHNVESLRRLLEEMK